MMKAQEVGTFAFIFDELPDGVCISNRHGDILYLNPAAERLLEIPPGSAGSWDFCDLLCGHLAAEGTKEFKTGCPLRQEGCEERAVTYAGRHGFKEAYRWEGESIRRQKRWKDLRVRCLKMPPSGFELDDQEKHLTLIEDVSALRELERQGEQWRDMVAHDLRSPLSNITATLNLLAEAPAGEPLGEKEKSLLAVGLRSARRMLEQLNDHLDIAKLDAGKMPLLPERVDLARLIESAAEEASPGALAKNIRIVAASAPGPQVMADPALLLRALQNLISNAVKFTPPGGKVEIGARADDPWGLLTVSDTGIGIPPEELPTLFDRFHQVQARQAGRIRGTGLGLAFCLEALKCMGGDIRVQSALGKGSEFTLRLPLSTRQASALKPRRSGADGEGP